MTDSDLLSALLRSLIDDIPPFVPARGLPLSRETQAMRVLGIKLGSRAQRPEEGVRRILKGEQGLSPGARVVADGLLREMWEKMPPHEDRLKKIVNEHGFNKLFMQQPKVSEK